MIKINLLPQKKGAKRGAATIRGGRPSMAGLDTTGQTQFLVGVAALIAAGAIVFFAVHRPMMKERKDLDETNNRLRVENATKRTALKDFENLKKLVAAAQERSDSIEKLVKAKAVPANLLHELGEILTPGHLPAMSADMAKRISDGPGGDPNKRFQLDWDPKHVWITSFIEKDGAFTLKGGAQSDPDVTQLAKRLQASVYFMDVTPKGGVRMSDRETGQQYYDFTITGKVVY
jgi:type IV pilus assembly protein PilN